LILLSASISGCTVHPTGEREERAASLRAGKPFAKSFEARDIPPLADNPTPDQIVQYACLTNADLEQRYWEWRAAIEQIRQDGSQTTTLNFAAGTTITRGSTGLGSSTVALANDPMTDIKWPGKLDAAAKQALNNARAAGRRFRKAQFELRAKVLNAYYDYALTAELIRLEENNQDLLKTTELVTESRNRAGSAAQQDILRAANELDLSGNDIANMRSQLAAQRATINALLSRAPDAALAIPTQLPDAQLLQISNEELLNRAAMQNPELQALADEIKGRQNGLELARLQYIPDFNASAGADLLGVSQSILGQATVPIFRYEAINAAIEQSLANLKAAQAMRRQSANDLAAQVVMDITTLRDAERQLDLLSHTILPRAQRGVALGRTAYESAQATLLDLTESQRSLITLQRLIANLQIVHAMRLADLEAITGGPLVSQNQHSCCFSGPFLCSKKEF
jgi:cobalt-zinc-cadmium efflux system outer membrane protein